jgi:hypothetical protein
MGIRKTIRLLLLAAGVLIAAPAAAQTTGDMSGRVTDSSGAVLPGVVVTATNVALQVPQTAVTSESGAFRFAQLALGTYRVQFELAGFKTLVLDDIRVQLGQNTELQPKLEISTVQETVTVSGESPVIDTRAVTTGGVFTKEQLDNIPSARDPWVILEMTPGVVMNQQNVGGNKSGQQSAFVSHGAAGGNTMWNVDGVTVTDMAATGSSATYYDFDAFEEIQITTGGNDASMQTGGINLNMVTKSGTNAFRGSGRLFVTDEEFQADNSTDELRAQGAGSGNPIQNIRDYGFEMGGPILRNKAWFWGGYGAQDIRVGVIGFVKDTAECRSLPADASVDQQRACLNTDLTLLYNYNAKVNANITASHKLNVHYALGDKVRNARDVSPTRTIDAAWKQSGPTATYKGGWQWLVSDRFLVDTSASYVDGGFILDFTRPELATVQAQFDLATALNSRSRFFDENIRPQTQVGADANWFLTNALGGDHTIKFGFKWRDTPTERFLHRGGYGIVTTRSNAAVEATMTRDQSSLQPLQTSSAYINDSFTRQRLTVNVGVRADYQDDSVEARGVGANPIVPELLPAVEFAGTDSGVTWLDISPRVGVTYDLVGDGRTILKASTSVYYGQGLFVSGALNPLNEVQLTFPWVDLNGDVQATRNELDLTRVRRDAGNWNPANPGAPTTPNRVDPDITNDRTREVIVGVDHELARNFAVSAMYIYRKLDGFQITERQGLVNADFVERTATLPCGNALCGAPQYTVNYFELRPGLTQPSATFLTNQDAWRTFNGVELSARKRFSDRWMLNTSLALNSALNYFGDGEHAYVDPTNIAQQEGRDALAQNARWVFKLTGMYAFPWDINVSGFFNAREGFPFNPTVQTDVRSGGLGRANVFVEPLGTQRLDNFYQVDLRIDKAFKFRKLNASFSVDVFNALNENTVLARTANYSATRAAWVTEILAPRVVRLGVRARF